MKKNKINKKRLIISCFLLAVLLSVGTWALLALNKSDNNAKNSSSDENIAANNKKKNDWKLLLVNPWNSLPDNFNVTLTDIEDGNKVDERIAADLETMLEACRAVGLSPYICSSYRTQEKQQQLFENKVNRLIDEGYTDEEAETEAATVVAVPGTSEHQLGLAVDIIDINNQNLDESQEKTEVQQWLMENSWKYGFILRYPNGKSDITGIIYEPWHYRYVGKEYAKEIFEQDISLEEYLADL